MKTILLGTRNAGKIKELKRLLDSTELNIVDLNSFRTLEEPVETGKTFAENAAIKASAYAIETNCYALADDSGLEVTVLGGKPGIYSARFAGNNATDAENNRKLLKELAVIESIDRSAQFVCAMSVSNPDGNIIFATSGTCTGTISDKPNGINGFGYDSLFVPSGFDKTFGVLSIEVKAKLSHRAAAARKIKAFLESNSFLLT